MRIPKFAHERKRLWTFGSIYSCELSAHFNCCTTECIGEFLLIAAHFLPPTYCHRNHSL